MEKIKIITEINAPIERCFLLSLSVELHCISTQETNEKAVAGVTSGILKLNDSVTWQAKHFGLYQRLTSKIVEYEYPTRFVDKMIKGAFKEIYHEHLYTQNGTTTLMTDVFEFRAPLGIIGEAFSKIILVRYMRKLLEKRNQTIKNMAESDGWKNILH